MGALVAVVGLGLVAVMGCAWLYQRAVRNVGWVDVFWTLCTGAAGVVLSLWPLQGAPTERQWLVAALAAAWSLRLGLFVAVRVARSPEEDRRYVDLRRQWGDRFQSRLLPFVLIQAPIALLLALAIMLAARAPQPHPGVQDVLGALILLIAVGGEALADEQMRRFKASHPPKGAINDKGLWAWSRHPNYFFEWFGWLAYPVIASPVILSGASGVYPWGWAAWIAPVLMYLVLDHGTGVPPLEAQMLKSRGDAFLAYKSRTSRFFPWPPRPPRA
jgi:steroid 5-alpha reductase family enzyme